MMLKVTIGLYLLVLASFVFSQGEAPTWVKVLGAFYLAFLGPLSIVGSREL